LNGGNGSAWYDEINFIPNEEIGKLGSTPFVSQKIELNTSKSKVWKVITEPSYAKSLGAMFDENAFIESTWQRDADVFFKYEPNMITKRGKITASWQDLYIQVDYDFDGIHYAEKFLILDNEEKGKTDLYVVSGPYGDDFEAKQLVWKNWLDKVEELVVSVE